MSPGRKTRAIVGGLGWHVICCPPCPVSAGRLRPASVCAQRLGGANEGFMQRAPVAAQGEADGSALLERVKWANEPSASANRKLRPSLLARSSVGKYFTFVTIAWAVIVLLGAVDLTWASLAGLKFSGWSRVTFAVSFLAAIGFYYDYSGRNARLADVGNYAALWVAFSLAGAMFTYVAATMRMPLQDAMLARVDAALGFHWTPWFHFIAAHRYLWLPLAIAYQTMLPQIIGSILFFAHTGRTDRNRELLSIAMLSLIVTTLISGMVPAVGPYIPGHQPDFALMLMAIREGAATTFALDNMKGIVSMPSYHTVMAIILIYVHRPPARSFRVVVALSGLMLLSVPSAGNHYLVDMIAGAAVAAGSIAIVRFWSEERGEFFGTSCRAILQQLTRGSSKFSYHAKSIMSAWAVVMICGAIDWIWAARAGFSINGIPPLLGRITILVAAGCVFAYAGRARWVSDAAHFLALWISLTIAIEIFSYSAATLRAPMWDQQFARIDAALGFDWIASFNLIAPHRMLGYLLKYSYNSILLQVLASIGYFAAIGRSDRNRELLWIGMLSALITASLSGILPAVGPYVKALPPWSAVLMAIRNGSLSRFAVGDLTGIVAFPSFHTAMAVFLIYVHRSPLRSFIPIAVLNAAMLLAIPFFGHHYLVDMIAGAAVAAVSIAIVQAALRQPRALIEPAVGDLEPHEARVARGARPSVPAGAGHPR
jgi:hypothetical protein